MRALGQVRNDAHKRYDAMARFNPEKASVVAAHMRNIDALAGQVGLSKHVVVKRVFYMLLSRERAG